MVMLFTCHYDGKTDSSSKDAPLLEHGNHWILVLVGHNWIQAIDTVNSKIAFGKSDTSLRLRMHLIHNLMSLGYVIVQKNISFS